VREGGKEGREEGRKRSNGREREGREGREGRKKDKEEREGKDGKEGRKEGILLPSSSLSWPTMKGGGDNAEACNNTR
jgi:hypothetical protein